MFSTLMFLIVLLLAYANGANDNFKGVATLYGSGTATYKSALIWTTAATAAGSLAALFLSQGLVATFSGKGLVPDAVTATKSFPLAVMLGASITILIATKFGFPVSTTHALTGGLVGAGLFASPAGVDFAKLGSAFFLPLLASPVVALVLAVGAFSVAELVADRFALNRDSCLCLTTKPVASPQLAARGSSQVVDLVSPGIMVGRSVEECKRTAISSTLGVSTGVVLDKLHFLSGGVVSFARALNDTPKIAAILLVGQFLAPSVSVVMVAAIMAIGGLAHSRSIAETMAHRVTNMSPSQGLAANLITSSLVIVASKTGLPVSTTHVACGTLFGIGTVTRTARWSTITSILIAWVTTLPLAGALSAGIYQILEMSNLLG